MFVTNAPLMGISLALMAGAGNGRKTVLGREHKSQSAEHLIKKLSGARIAYGGKPAKATYLSVTILSVFMTPMQTIFAVTVNEGKGA